MFLNFNVSVCRHLGQRVQLECDGQRIPLPELQGIVVLNIPSFMGGTNFWGGTRADDIFLAPSFDDRILEVLQLTGFQNIYECFEERIFLKYLNPCRWWRCSGRRKWRHRG